MPDRVTINIDGGVADVCMNRPDKHNALDGAMFKALTAVGKDLADNKAVRAVVLSGAGPSFCAGLDFASFMAMGDGSETGAGLFARDNGAIANTAQSPAWVWTEVPVPVIAAVHGHCYGGGLQIALGTDIRFVKPDARLSVMEIKWGLIPDMSGTQTLRRLVRDDVAKELTFTGRIFSGTEAVELGVCSHAADDPKHAALEMAHLIAGKSPDAIRAGKNLLDQSRILEPKGGLKLEAALQGRLLGSPNQLESIAANMQKRAPEFSDPK